MVTAEAVKVRCPHCGQKIRITPELFGQVVECPACHGALRYEVSGAPGTISAIPQQSLAGLKPKKLAFRRTAAHSRAKSFMTETMGRIGHSLRRGGGKAGDNVARLREDHQRSTANFWKLALALGTLGVVAIILAVAVAFVKVKEKTAREEEGRVRRERLEGAMEISRKAISEHGDLDTAEEQVGKILLVTELEGHKAQLEKELAKIRKARETGIATTLLDLEKQAAKLASEGSFRQASEVYSGYQGRFAEETAETRAKLAKELAVKAGEAEVARLAAESAAEDLRLARERERLAEEERRRIEREKRQRLELEQQTAAAWEQLLEGTAALLLAGKRDQALRSVEAAAAATPQAETIAALREILTQLTAVDQFAANGLRARIGKNETMTLAGIKRSVTINEVEDGRVRVTILGGNHPIRTSETVAKLDEVEKFNWLGSMPPASRSLHMGLLAFAQGRNDTAVNLFGQADSPLAPVLLRVANISPAEAPPAPAPPPPMEDEKTAEAMIAAAQNGNLATMEQMLRGGTSPNIRDGVGRTPLLMAAENGQLPVVELLLRNGAEVDGKDLFGRTALHAAAASDNLPSVEMLLAQGANINAAIHMQGPSVRNFPHGATPLHLAARNGHMATVEFLLAKGANPNLIDRAGNTPLADAETFGRNNIVELLKKQIDAPPIFAAMEKGDTAHVDKLLRGGVDVNVKDAEEATPLHYAAIRGDLEMAKLLIDRRATVNSTDAKGDAPLHRAAANGNRLMVSLLIGNGAVVNIQNKQGRTPLHLVAVKGDIQTAELLITSGASLAIRDLGQDTPLSLAEKAKNKEMVELLNKLLKRD